MIYFGDFNRSFSENRYVIFETQEEFELAHYEHHYYKIPQLYKIDNYRSVFFDCDFHPKNFPLFVKLDLSSMGIDKGKVMSQEDIQKILPKLIAESQNLNALIQALAKEGE